MSIKRTTRAIYQPHSPISLTMTADEARGVIQALRQQAAYSTSIASNASSDDIRTLATGDATRYTAIADKLARQFNYPEG